MESLHFHCTDKHCILSLGIYLKNVISDYFPMKLELFAIGLSLVLLLELDLSPQLLLNLQQNPTLFPFACVLNFYDSLIALEGFLERRTCEQNINQKQWTFLPPRNRPSKLKRSTIPTSPQKT